MTGVTNQMLYDLAREICDQREDVGSGLSELRVELHAMRGVCIAIQQDIHGIYGLLARRETHLDRIEQRVGLRV